MKLALARGSKGELVHARLQDEDGKLVWTAHSNPLLDSRKYEVKYANGYVNEITANVIAENLIAQMDKEGRQQMMFGETMNHRVLPEAIPESHRTYVNPYGLKKKTTTCGWEILVEWKDGSMDWIALKDVKESYPVELAQYAVNRSIQEVPAFAWWTPYVLKKCKRILQKEKSKYWSRTYKYGIRIPKTIQEAMQIDKVNRNTL